PCAPCCTRRATRWAEHGNECPLFRRSCPCEGTRGLRGRRGVVIISPVATVICESGRGPAGEGAYGTESAPEPRHPVTGGTRRCSRAGGHRPLARLGVAMIDVMRRAAKGQVRPRPQPWKELDDSGLVAQFLAGEKRAFSELVGRDQVRLLNFLYRTIGDRDRAEDLVQETFVRVYRHLHRFDQSKKFSTWVYTIASNLAKNELRNRSRNPLVLFQTIKKNWEADHRPLEWEDNTYRPDDLYRKRHLKEMVERAVAQLPEHHR